MADEYVTGFLSGLLFALAIFAVIIVLLPDFNLSYETKKDICVNLTNNSAAEPSVENGKLICEVPSYDSTTNIIVRKAGESK